MSGNLTDADNQANFNHFAQSLEAPDNTLYNRGGLVIFTGIAIAIAVISILLRFWARYLSTGFRFSRDDWLALAALPLALGIMVSEVNSIPLGVGEHITDLGSDRLTYILQLFYVGQLLFILETSLLRFSVLAFYARIFPIHRSSGVIWLRFYFATVSMACIWPVFVLLFDALFICEPISKYWYYWDENYAGTCVSMSVVYYIETIGSLVVNLMTLIVPLPQIFKLNMKWRKKLAVAFSFLLGYGVAFMSFGRLIMSVELGSALDYDPIFFLIPYLYWTTAEVGLSILAVCLPAMFQLTRRSRQQGIRSLFRSKSTYVPAGSTLGGPHGMSTAALGRVHHQGGGPTNSSTGPLVLQQQQLDWNNLYDKGFWGTHVNVTAGEANNNNNGRKRGPGARGGLVRGRNAGGGGADGREDSGEGITGGLQRSRSEDGAAMGVPMEGISVTHDVVVEMRPMV